jgi:hypothetical protein
MEESLKKHRDLKNVMDTRERLGFEKGIEKTAIGLFKEGVDIEVISKVTGLSEDELQRLFRKEGLI